MSEDAQPSRSDSPADEAGAATASGTDALDARGHDHRARAFSPRTGRMIGVVALGAGAAVAAGGILHAVLTTPPPAYAVFAADQEQSGNAASLGTGDSAAWSSELSQQGTIVLDGPHLFGSPDDPVRVGVYREWLDAERSEVCTALVVDSARSLQTTCTSEEGFRRSGVTSTLNQEGTRIDFGWMPDGEVLLDVVQTGAMTLDDVLALGLPALESIEASTLDLDLAREVLPAFSSVLAGPLELGRFDGWRFYAAVVEGDAAPWEAEPRPQICLAARDDRTRADGSVIACAAAERFMEEGLALRTEDGIVVEWDADGVFDVELT